MTYIKSVARIYSHPTIQEWHIGESEYLKRMLYTGFYNTLYISKDGVVEFHYDQSECDNFEKALENYLDEETFNDICNEFMRKIEGPEVKIREIVPHLTVFNEVDEYPEWFEEQYRGDCLRRLMRVRQSTEPKLYQIMKPSELKNFIYFQGKTYPLEHKDKFLSKTFRST
ncbi:MAG: hypothetical protein KKF67_01790 [Nanoarchaeota archaeon]|nr:hypothetical protein [Nanoarchaeota archaeon]